MYVPSLFFFPSIENGPLRGNILYIVDESYTSKTCGRCGNLNNKLGGNKIYKCTNCNLVIDRDINGARNILLKHTVLV